MCLQHGRCTGTLCRQVQSIHGGRGRKNEAVAHGSMRPPPCSTVQHLNGRIDGTTRGNTACVDTSTSTSTRQTPKNASCVAAHWKPSSRSRVGIRTRPLIYSQCTQNQRWTLDPHSDTPHPTPPHLSCVVVERPLPPPLTSRLRPQPHGPGQERVQGSRR